MNNKKWLVILFSTILIIVPIAILINKLGKSLAEDNPGYIAIKNTLQSYLEIDAKARYTLDDSRLGEVLANDPRGNYSGAPGESRYIVKAVRWYNGNPDIQEDHIGMLDFWHAFYEFNRQVTLIYENAQATGTLPTPTEDPADLGALRATENAPGDLSPYHTSLESLPEIQALMKETGFQGVNLPRPLPEVIVPEKFAIHSITVDNDLAHVIGDFSYAKVDLTFAKLSGQWYLAGLKIVQWHAG